jgi:hypothetical protein
MENLRFDSYTIRPAAILTTSYVAAKVLGLTDKADGTQIMANPFMANGLELECLYTKGSLTSVEIKIEFSQDGTNFVQETNKVISGGTTTLTVNEYTSTTSTNFHISLPIMANYIRVSAKGTGTVTSSSLAIVAKLAWR